MLQKIGQFNRIPTEDPHIHLRLFMEMSNSFKIVSYFPPRKNDNLQNEITTFQQIDDESLYEAWERFIELLRKCPHHEIPYCTKLETFYNGLNAHTRLVVDAFMNGGLLSKSYNEDYEIVERIDSNIYQWPKNRAASGRQVARVHEVDALTSLSTQNCPSNLESIYYIGNQYQNRSGQGPQSNFYNPSWRNHPNFSWSYQKAGLKSNYM
ncbi:Retrotransposon gag protein [Gossypium australe]|uniref:Retrotransposon gag protein n=1 Tax=Gossypium australe TaxID=47621 RepID=A0A5B6UYA8_9ROSI|nr:Retrotransposon gag protein [Gossypium australe]